jgi:hypothetical protein
MFSVRVVLRLTSLRMPSIFQIVWWKREVTLFLSVLCGPPLVYRNRRTPPIDSREVPFPKCAFRQSPHKINIDIGCENKNHTSLSFPYLSFCRVLDSYSVISYIPQILSLPFSLWIRYLKPSLGWNAHWYPCACGLSIIIFL